MLDQENIIGGKTVAEKVKQRVPPFSADLFAISKRVSAVVMKGYYERKIRRVRVRHRT